MLLFYRAICLIFNERLRHFWFSVFLTLSAPNLIFSADYNESRYFLEKKGKGEADIPVIALGDVSGLSEVQIVKASDFFQALKFRSSIDIYVVPSTTLRRPEDFTDFNNLLESQKTERKSFQNPYFQTSPFQRLLINPNLRERIGESPNLLFQHLVTERGFLPEKHPSFLNRVSDFAKKTAQLGNRVSDFNRNCLNNLKKVDVPYDVLRPVIGLGTIGLITRVLFSTSPQYRYSRLVRELGCDESVAMSLLEQLRLCSSSSKTLSVALDPIPAFRKNGHSEQEIMEHARLAIYYCIDKLDPNEKGPLLMKAEKIFRDFPRRGAH